MKHRHDRSGYPFKLIDSVIAKNGRLLVCINRGCFTPKLSRSFLANPNSNQEAHPCAMGAIAARQY